VVYVGLRTSAMLLQPSSLCPQLSALCHRHPPCRHPNCLSSPKPVQGLQLRAQRLHKYICTSTVKPASAPGSPSQGERLTSCEDASRAGELATGLTRWLTVRGVQVIGTGGGGSNAVNRMMEAQLEGVEFWIVNTDAQALTKSPVDGARQIQIGAQLTRGLGAGGNPDIGQVPSPSRRRKSQPTPTCRTTVGEEDYRRWRGRCRKVTQGLLPVRARVTVSRGETRVDVGVRAPARCGGEPGGAGGDGARCGHGVRHGTFVVARYIPSVHLLYGTCLTRCCERSSAACVFPFTRAILPCGACWPGRQVATSGLLVKAG
jgi:hypothetical protein